MEVCRRATWTLEAMTYALGYVGLVAGFLIGWLSCVVLTRRTR